MAKIANATFEGQSGVHYYFETFSLDHEFDNIGAIYIFSKRTYENRKGSHKFLYVGQTDQLANRIISHEKWPCLTAHDVNCICVLQDGNKHSRENIEKDLIRSDDPPCNRQS